MLPDTKPATKTMIDPSRAGNIGWLMLGLVGGAILVVVMILRAIF